MQTVTSSDGTTIAFDVHGDGPPLVHVGGALNDRNSGAPLAAALAGYSVLTYDRWGRGDSGDTPPYAVDREVDDLAALIDRAGGQAAVYGISSGAALALEAAARGLPITRLAVYEVPYRTAESQSGNARRYSARLRRLLAEGRRGDALELFMTLVGMPLDMLAQMRQAPMWPALEALAPSLAYDSAVMGDERGELLPADRLATVPMPTLVLAGGASPQWMRDVAVRVAGAVPGGRYRCLDGQTHDVAPDTLAPVLAEFLGEAGRP